MQYHVRSYRPGQTSITEEQLEFADESALRQAMQSQGKTVLSLRSISTSTAPRLKWASSTRGRFPLFCKELSTLIHAGMTVVEAVDTLCARERLQSASDTIAMVLFAHLQQGKSLSSALMQLPDAPPVLIAAVRAGERTSNLAEALTDYLKFDAQVQHLRSKVISAAIYPALVTGLGLAISLFLLIVVMPSFASMYENLRSTASGSTAITIAISQFVGHYTTQMMLLLVGITLALAFWVTSGRAKQDVSRWAQMVPSLQRRIEDFQLAQVYQTLTLLLKGGYPMTQAMLVAKESALSPRLQAALAQALQQIEHGGLVSKALAQAKLGDEVDRRLLAAAERNGNFHLATAVVAQLHSERFEVFLERLTRVIEPVLLMFVALMVGGIVIMMYLPVFDMATSLR